MKSLKAKATRLHPLLLSMLTACARVSTTPESIPQQSLTERLVVEAEALRDFLAPLHLFFMLGMIALAILAGRAVRFGTFLLWRLGLDAKRHLPAYGSAIHAALVGLVVLMLLRRLALKAPIVSAIVLVVALSVLVRVYAGSLQNLAAGVVLGLRRHLREGDHVFVESYSGVVHEVGLLSTRLKTAEGAMLVLPNRVLNQAIVRVERRQPGVPLAMDFSVPEAANADLAERVRAVALLSPYRAASADVHVRLSDDGRTLHLHTRVWEADHALEDAQRYFRKKLVPSELAPPGESLAPEKPPGLGREVGRTTT